VARRPGRRDDDRQGTAGYEQRVRNSDIAAQTVILPTPGHSLVVAWRDVVDGARLAPVWLYTGWIDVVQRFRRTRLGQFWHTLSLAAFILVMGVLWSTILRQDPIDYLRFTTTSLIVWSLISGLVTDGTMVIINGQATALSMRFPYTAFAMGHVWRGLLMFAHHFVLYILVMTATLYPPGWTGLLAVPGLLLVVANGFWMSLLVGMLALRRRDVIPAVGSAMQIMMFVTPVLWPKELLGPKLAFAADLNPLYHLVRVARDPLMGLAPGIENWAWAIGLLLVGGGATLWLYGRWRNRMPYWF